jgi:hypothetical protein
MKYLEMKAPKKGTTELATQRTKTQSAPPVSANYQNIHIVHSLTTRAEGTKQRGPQDIRLASEMMAKPSIGLTLIYVRTH